MEEEIFTVIPELSFYFSSSFHFHFLDSYSHFLKLKKELYKITNRQQYNDPPCSHNPHYLLSVFSDLPRQIWWFPRKPKSIFSVSLSSPVEGLAVQHSLLLLQQHCAILSLSSVLRSSLFYQLFTYFVPLLFFFQIFLRTFFYFLGLNCNSNLDGETTLISSPGLLP